MRYVTWCAKDRAVKVVWRVGMFLLAFTSILLLPSHDLRPFYNYHRLFSEEIRTQGGLSQTHLIWRSWNGGKQIEMAWLPALKI